MSRKRSREQAVLDLPGAEEALLLEGVSSDRNLFDLQVAELLSERRLEYVGADADVMADIIRRLGKVLRALPEQRVESPPQDVAQFLQRLGLLQRPLRFSPPARVYPMGSWAARTVARPSTTVDIAVEIPKACFDEKDQLNGRYFARRAQYLAHVAAALRKKAAFKRLGWEFLQHDARRPVLVIHSQAKGQEEPLGFSLRLIPTIAVGTFAAPKLAPGRNNLRPAGPGVAASAGAAEQPLPATPLYNNAILQDMWVDAQQHALQAAIEALPRLPEAIVLLKVWARAQGLEAEPDGINGFLLSMLAVHLTDTGTLTAAMTPLQLMRACIAALAKGPTFAKGLVMARQQPPEAEAAQSAPPHAAAFRQHHSVVWVDPSGRLNLAACVQLSALAQAQGAAKRALALLDAPRSAEGAFAALFLARPSRPMLYDALWRVSLPLPEDALPLSRDRPAWRELESRVEAVAQEALGSRALQVRVLRGRLGACGQLAECIPSGGRLDVLLAAQLDPAAALRAVDAGPPAESAKAAAFREFWGERSELRRFQAGNIVEAVVWECGPSQRHLIADRALAYALQRHLGPGTQVSGCAGLLDAAMLHRRAQPDSLPAARRELEAALTKLGKQLRALGSLPLKVVGVQPLSAAARHTAAFPPLPHPLIGGSSGGGAANGNSKTERVPRCLEAVDVLVQLEGSGRWPDDPEAFLKAKAAMGCQLAEELSSGFGLHARPSEHCVDVLTDGFAFRLFLSSERDAAMAARIESGRQAGVGPQSALAAAAAHGLLQPRARHHGAMAALAGAAPAFPAAAQLAGRWLAAQMLSSHLPQEGLELIVASAFLPDWGLPIPGSRLAGFMRFLQILAEHPWRERPLVIDPEGSLLNEQRAAAEASHRKAQRDGTAPAMCLITGYDQSAQAWTQLRPSTAVVHRLAALARRSLAVLQGHMERGEPDAEAVCRAVFGPALADFDALLLLRHDALPAADLALQGPKLWRAAAAKVGFAPLPGEQPGQEDRSARALLRAVPQEMLDKRGPERVIGDLLVGFDPVAAFLQLAEQRYGDAATFCADALGGAVVQKPHPLDPALAHVVAPVGSVAEDLGARKGRKGMERSVHFAGMAAGNDLVVALDAEGLLMEMAVMGAGLVEEVLVKGHCR